eukprot:TRINITY_DN982_c0_g1_i8.p5 TRINITY_DN982_c0_g1~~TRINITY_DN982_c0_g1_i8.p5  ORF type:complete len:126 (-),score=1.54 TRINITY_DN982_c0_g1_i8:52-429(-)
MAIFAFFIHWWFQGSVFFLHGGSYYIVPRLHLVVAQFYFFAYSGIRRDIFLVYGPLQSRSFSFFLSNVFVVSVVVFPWSRQTKQMINILQFINSKYSCVWKYDIVLLIMIVKLRCTYYGKCNKFT